MMQLKNVFPYASWQMIHFSTMEKVDSRLNDGWAYPLSWLISEELWRGKGWCWHRANTLHSDNNSITLMLQWRLDVSRPLHSNSRPWWLNGLRKIQWRDNSSRGSCKKATPGRSNSRAFWFNGLQTINLMPYDQRFLQWLEDLMIQ